MSANTSPPDYGHQCIAFENSEFRSIEQHRRARLLPPVSKILFEIGRHHRLDPAWIIHEPLTPALNTEEGM